MPYVICHIIIKPVLSFEILAAIKFDKKATVESPDHIDGLMQERHNSIGSELELQSFLH